jgi:hypothetical protein
MLTCSDVSRCTRELIACRTSAGCTLDATVDQASGYNALDLCAAEGCTAEACGLPASLQTCNQSSLKCSDYYLGCASGEQGSIAFDPNSVGVGNGASFTVSADRQTVKWSGSDSAGAAFASRGVHSGKYYWEVKVPGKCALVGVGVAQPSMPGFVQSDKYTYPGFDERSWALGDFGYGSALFHSGLSSEFGDGMLEGGLIGVALDASQGLLWFAVNGQWLEGGDPERGLQPAAVLSPNLKPIVPVIGVLPSCNLEVEIHANFGSVPFMFTRPPSFVPMKSDECTCTAGFVSCMLSQGCNDTKNMHALSQHCVSKG